MISKMMMIDPSPFVSPISESLRSLIANFCLHINNFELKIGSYFHFLALLGIYNPKKKRKNSMKNL